MREFSTARHVLESTRLVVEHQPLVLEYGKLNLGEPREKRVLRQIYGSGFISSQMEDFTFFALGLGL